MKRATIVFIATIAILGSVAGYYWQTYWNKGLFVPSVVGSTSGQHLKPASDSETAIHYAVSDPESGDMPKEMAGPITHSSLTLDESDETIVSLLGKLVSRDLLESLFNSKEIIRRFVVTVDNATDLRFPKDFSIFKPLSDEFKVDNTTDGPILSPTNYPRYSAYVDLLTSIDSEKLVAIYARYYSLFQSAYRELGMSGYFNDRLVAAIDNALAAPSLTAPIKLVHDKCYRFADPDLESRSISQKLLLRIGPENATHVKKKLRQFRKLLTHLNRKKRNRAG